MQKQTGTHRSPRKAAFCGSLAGEARRSLAGVVAAGVEAYRRERHLPRLIGVSEKDLTDVSPNAQRAIVARLARALRAERNRGRARHWTYDLNRHIGLMQAYAAERSRTVGPSS
jgi:hypothetical protein